MASGKRMKSNPVEPATIDDTIDRIRRNDETLTRAVFNKISLLQFGQIFSFLETNTFLRELALSDIGIGDCHAEMIGTALVANKTLKCLWLDNNKFSLRGILQIIEAVGTNRTVIDLNFANQNTESRSRERSQLEIKIVEMVEKNDTVEKLALELWDKTLQQRLDSQLSGNRQRREEAASRGSSN